MNVPVPAAFAVYVNVYVIPFVAVHVTALLLNVTTPLLCAIAPLVKLNVLIALPVLIHVNITFHVLYHATVLIGVFVGCVVTVHTGFTLSILLTVIAHVPVFHALSCM